MIVRSKIKLTKKYLKCHFKMIIVYTENSKHYNVPPDVRAGVSGSDGLLLSNIHWHCDVNNQKHISTFITLPHVGPVAPREMEIVTTKAGAVGKILAWVTCKAKHSCSELNHFIMLARGGLYLAYYS